MNKPFHQKFTQCGSLTIFFVLFIILFGVSSSALTTFGKSNPNQNAQQPVTPTPDLRTRISPFYITTNLGPKVQNNNNNNNNNNMNNDEATMLAKAKDCTTQADCATLQNTSCVKAPYDDKLRCLCGDNKPAINGYCSATQRGLRHMCLHDGQCESGMVCMMDNSTKPMKGVGNKNSIPVGGGGTVFKVCMCDEDEGFFENKIDHICSGAPIFAGSLTFATIVSILVSFKKFFN